MSFRFSVALFLVVVLAVLPAAPPARVHAAESFRIETKIYVGDEEEPTSKSTTLFHEGVVYDFLEKPEQTAVFRKPTGEKPARFVLLNDQQQLQTEISGDRLQAAMKDLRTWASQKKDPFLQFSAAPRFDETFDRSTGKLVLASYLTTYTVETISGSHPDAVAPYREYLDWYTQLNTLLTAGNPPDPRLKLNDALARHKAFPLKIERKRAGEDPVRAEHDFTWRLSSQDLQRIDDVHNALTKYRSVDNPQFLKESQPVDTGK